MKTKHLNTLTINGIFRAESNNTYSKRVNKIAYGIKPK